MGQDFTYLINIHYRRKCWVFCEDPYQFLQKQIHIQIQKIMKLTKKKKKKGKKTLRFSMGVTWAALPCTFREQHAKKLGWRLDLRQREGEIGREREVGE